MPYTKRPSPLPSFFHLLLGKNSIILNKILDLCNICFQIRNLNFIYNFMLFWPVYTKIEIAVLVRKDPLAVLV